MSIEKCDKSKVKLVFREARKQGVKLSKDVLDNSKPVLEEGHGTVKDKVPRKTRENEEEKTTEEEEKTSCVFFLKTISMANDGDAAKCDLSEQVLHSPSSTSGKG